MKTTTSSKQSVKFPALAPALAGQIVDWVRSERLDAGHKLREEALAQVLGVSRSPVRKALQLLAERGVVSATPNIGFALSQSAQNLLSFELEGSERGAGQEVLTDDELYMRIANARIDGLLAEEVSETELMERFACTRVHTQRVLSLMVRDRMVERKTGRGWLFKPLLTDHASLIESYRYRMVVEPAAVLEPGYSPNLTELQKCRIEQTELLQRGAACCTPAQLFRTGEHLHETIVAGANNRFLLDGLRHVNQMRRVLEYSLRIDEDRLQRQCGEHLSLIDLLQRGERMEAAHFLREHLNRARRSKLAKSDD